MCGNIYEYVNVYVVICGGGRSCTYVKLVALEQTIYLISRTPPVDSILYVGVLYVVYNNLLLYVVVKFVILARAVVVGVANPVSLPTQRSLLSLVTICSVFLSL